MCTTVLTCTSAYCVHPIEFAICFMFILFYHIKFWFIYSTIWIFYCIKYTYITHIIRSVHVYIILYISLYPIISSIMLQFKFYFIQEQLFVIEYNCSLCIIVYLHRNLLFSRSVPLYLLHCPNSQLQNLPSLLFFPRTFAQLFLISL